jgi:dethiobiotin synthetase
MKQGYFVTGTDTGIGKTTVSCALLRAFAAQGHCVIGMKPVAAGCRREGDVLASEDVELLRTASSLNVAAELVNPYAFEPPIAPHIAAGQVGVEIDLARIHAAFKKLQTQADIVVVEGVGGFYVPLNARQDMADMAVMLGLPVILVVGMRLGCLSHALLTAEAVAHRGLALAGWVANFPQATEVAVAHENIIALLARMGAPLLGIVGYQEFPDVAKTESLLHLQFLK